MKKITKFTGVAMGALVFASLLSGAAVSAGADIKNRDNISAEQSGKNVSAEQSEDEMSAYLFVHFVGEGTAHEEQIYFSVSEDGTHWRTLNGKSPVLESTVGEKGVRDPNIVRKPDGSGFYLIATDLSIYNRNWDWGGSQTAGSRGVVVWESKNLVDWNLKGLKTIARENATCTWAPEAIYDDEKEAYMVYWASKTKEDWTHRVYRCYTKDFETFTKPEIYIEAEESRIDTTFIKEGDTYYRFTKDEKNTYVYMEKSDSLSGEFEAVNTYTLNGASHTQYTGYEGPTVYKLNGEDKWCLLLDNYGKSAGYKPFVTSDISKGRFESGEEFDFGGVKFRHGTVIPITKGEYNALLEKYPFVQDVEETTGSGELIYSLNFEDELTAGTGTAAATAHGTVSYEAGANGGKAVRISGDGNYVSIDGSMLSGLKSFTVSLTAKVSGRSWIFYVAPDEGVQTYRSEKYIGALADNGNITCERYNSNDQDRPASAKVSYAQDEWIHLTLVYRASTLRVYVNGALQSKIDSSVDLANLLGSTPIIQLGKANWGSGEYSNMALDSFKIYNYELSGTEVETLYKNDMGA